MRKFLDPHTRPSATFLAALLFGGFFALPQTTRDPPGMVPIPAGEFWMGRVHLWMPDELSWVERDRLDDRPSHLVYVDAFFLDKFEVTNEDYAVFVADTKRAAPYHWKGGKPSEAQLKKPVYNVNYADAANYCTWAGKRLPTEAEWERAARGNREKTLYPWGDDLGARGRGAPPAAPQKLAHYGFPNGPAAVGSYPPNDFGLHDMVGNVWEWVADWYERNYYSRSPDKNPQGPASGAYRVVRGSSWSDNDERMLGVHYRNYVEPDVRTPTIGFRCAVRLLNGRNSVRPL